MHRNLICVGALALLSLSALADTQRGNEAYAAGDLQTAAHEYMSAAQDGDADAQDTLGVMYFNGEHFQKNHVEAAAWFRSAAEQGHDKAQFNLGLAYERGEGVDKDQNEAVRWYRKAAEQGNARAQFVLGVMYRHGRGVEQSDADAASWYRKGAEQGHARAQAAIGLMYEQGAGVKQSDVDAATWHRLAAELGDDVGQGRLAAAYEHGRGVEKDIAKAVELYEKAAKQGNSAAARALGRLHALGKVEGMINVHSAVAYYVAAAKLGDEGAYDEIPPLLKTIHRKTVRVAEANVRQHAGETHEVLGTAKRGETVYTIGAAEGWYLVYQPEGPRSGWMSESLLDEVNLDKVDLNAANAESGILFPVPPAPHPSHIYCVTSCTTDGICYRSFTNGAREGIKALRVFDTKRREWKWDAGAC